MKGYADKFYCSYYLDAPASGSWPSGNYFGDAGGGTHNLFSTLRRCGIGVVCMQGSSCLFGLKTFLRNSIQTVHRGEAEAALVLIMHLEDHAVVDYFGDNQSFVDNFNKGYEYCRTTLNADIYQEIFRLIGSKCIKFIPHWMPSHLLSDPERKRKRSKKPKPVPDWVEYWHKVGNDHADGLASEACKSFEVDAGLAQPVIDRVSDLKLIQRRLASVICHLPSRPKVPRLKPIPRPSVTFDDMFHMSSHTFLPINSTFSWLSRFGMLSCACCHASCSTKSNRLKAFLTGTCNPVRVQGSTQRFLSGTISINGAHSHPSHKLQISGSYYVCVACGFKASKRLYNLKDPCLPQRRSSYGDTMLKALAGDTLELHGAAPRAQHGSLAPGKRSGSVNPANGVPIGNAFGFTINNMHSTGQPSSSNINMDSPAPGTEDPLNIKELKQLNDAGEKVVMPDGSGDTVVSTFSPIRNSPCPPTHGSFSHWSMQGLEDLLDLSDTGEQVVWPLGFSASRAREFITNYKMARSVGQLYRGV